MHIIQYFFGTPVHAYATSSVFNDLLPATAQADIVGVSTSFISANWGLIILIGGTLLAVTAITILITALSGRHH